MQGLTYFVCITELGHFVSVVEGLKGEKGEIIALEGGARERKRDHAWCLFSREVLGMFARFHCSKHLLLTAVGGARTPTCHSPAHTCLSLLWVGHISCSGRVRVWGKVELHGQANRASNSSSGASCQLT